MIFTARAIVGRGLASSFRSSVIVLVAGVFDVLSIGHLVVAVDSKFHPFVVVKLCYGARVGRIAQIRIVGDVVDALCKGRLYTPSEFVDRTSVDGDELAVIMCIHRIDSFRREDDIGFVAGTGLFTLVPIVGHFHYHVVQTAG